MANAALAATKPGIRRAAFIRRRPPLPGLFPRIHPFDLVATALRHRRLMLQWALSIGLLTAVAVYFVISQKYESETVILPPEHPAAPLTGGTLAQLDMDLAKAQGVKTKDAQEFWSTVVNTRTVSDYMINRFDLYKEYKTTIRTSAERKLMRRTTLDEEKSGLISIKVKDPSAQKAADLANGYVAALQDIMNGLAVSDANQRQAFFQAQVTREQEQLKQAEAALGAMQARTGVVTLKGQVGLAIGQIGRLKGEIAAKTVEMEALGSSATAQDPDMMRLQAEMDGLKHQLAEVERENPGAVNPGDILPNALPDAGVDYVRAVRDLKYHESLYQALARHAAGAVMDEVRSAPAIQVVDVAVPSEKPAGLPRPLSVAIGVVAGAILGLAYGMARDRYRKMKISSTGRYRIHLIRAALGKGPRPVAAVQRTAS